MALILDIAVVIILILGAIIGWKKGFAKYIISSIGTVTAIVIAFLIADSIAPTVYEKFLQEPVREHIEKRLEKFDVVSVVAKEIKDSGYDVDISDKELEKALSSKGDISKGIAQYANKTGDTSADENKLQSYLENFFATRFPGEFNTLFSGIDTQKLGDSVNNTKNQSYDVVRALAENDTKLGAKYIEDSFAKPFNVVIVKIILTILLFIIISILIRVLLSVTGIFDHIIVVNGINKFFGLVMGLIKHCALILVAVFALSVLIKTAGDSFSLINTRIINETYLFRHLFNLFYDI